MISYDFSSLAYFITISFEIPWALAIFGASGNFITDINFRRDDHTMRLPAAPSSSKAKQQDVRTPS